MITRSLILSATIAAVLAAQPAHSQNIGDVIRSSDCSAIVTEGNNDFYCIKGANAYIATQNGVVTGIEDADKVLISLYGKEVRGEAWACDSLLALNNPFSGKEYGEVVERVLNDRKFDRRELIRYACVKDQHSFTFDKDLVVIRITSAEEVINSPDRPKVSAEDYIANEASGVYTIARPDLDPEGNLIGGTKYTVIIGFGKIDYESVTIFRDNGMKAIWISYNNEIGYQDTEDRLDNRIDLIEEGLSASGIAYSGLPPYSRMSRKNEDFQAQFEEADELLLATRERFKKELQELAKLPIADEQGLTKFVNRIFE